jgi:hypothetical protein
MGRRQAWAESALSCSPVDLKMSCVLGTIKLPVYSRNDLSDINAPALGTTRSMQMMRTEIQVLVPREHAARA